jgi:predicted nucleic acid-binding protein
VPRAIADTGPLVAYLDRAEQHHAWAVERVASLEAPLLTCEPVLAETMYLLAGLSRAEEALWELLTNGALRIALHIEDHATELRALHRKYHDRPMSLADACIVRMADLFDDHAVFTLDSDFSIYRKRGREALTVISPP